MKIKFSEMTRRNAWIALFLFASFLEGSIFPLLLLLLLLQEKRNLLGKFAEVKTKNDNNSNAIQEQKSQIFGLQNDLNVVLNNQDICADKSEFLEVKGQVNSLNFQVTKQQKAIEKHEHKINTEQTSQNLMLSKTSKQANQISLLQREINSLQEMLKPMPEKVIPIQRRTLLAIDSANFNYAAKSLGVKIDYEGLKRYINTRFGSLEARIYVGEFTNDSKQKIWFKYLRDRGYVIKTKPVVWHGDTPKANVDVDLALDVANDGANFKNVVLCSGDGDFLPLVRQLQKQGIKVIVLNLPDQTNYHLRKVADEYINLRDIIGEIGDREQA